MDNNSQLLQEIYNDDMLKKTKESKSLNEIFEEEYDDFNFDDDEDDGDVDTDIVTDDSEE